MPFSVRCTWRLSGQSIGEGRREGEKEILRLGFEGIRMRLTARRRAMMHGFDRIIGPVKGLVVLLLSTFLSSTKTFARIGTYLYLFTPHKNMRRLWCRSAIFAKRCESLNTMTSFLWWIIGFYWVINGGEVLLQEAPRLYWLTVVFLAFDVFFAIFCVALACVIGVALCCCLPCIIAILYAVAGQEGASEADISILPRYRYVDSCDNGAKMPVEGIMVPIANNGGSSSDERVLLREDAECCICLTSYENGAELHSLPCNHHFHSSCIVKWLRINATCPLCKYNILKGNDCV